ncbi:MAG: PepSY domain-containing protein [Pedobacter sp.]|nr:MAG: PepSY domain-containing protein [Pedobacter sp.]
MLKKIIRQSHLWIGIASGFIVFILGITGCILTFVEEIKPVVYSDHYFVDVASMDPTGVPKKRPSITALLEVAKQHWGPDKPVSALEVENDPQRTWHFRSFEEDNNEGIWYWNEKKYYESLYVNPYTGVVLRSEDSEFEFFRFILYVHWSLLLKTDIGQPIIGVATLCFVFLLLTGLYLWWPKNKKANRVRFWFRWKKGMSIKRKNYDLHSILGFYSISISLIIGLTGMIWAFPWFDESVQSLLNKIGEQDQRQAKSIVVPKENTIADKVDVYESIYTDVQQKYPTARGYYFYFPRKPKAPVNVVVRYAKSYQSLVRQYDSNNGTLINSNGFSSKDNGQKMRILTYDLHLGSILGLTGKVIVFLASLVAASMPITGLYIWLNRKKRLTKK